MKGLRLIDTARSKASVMSFVIDGHANEAVAHHLDARGIAVRADVDVFLEALHALPPRPRRIPGYQR